MSPIIEVENLTKHFKVRKHHQGRFSALHNFFTREYRLVKAVDQISFQVNPGELVGYIGPNGAGKSTTLKMISGLLVPTSGYLRVNGYLPWKEREAYVANIGAVFGQRTTLWWDLPVVESIELLRHMYAIPKDRFEQNLKEFNRILELEPFLNTPVRSLSLGQRMRADLCAAFLHDPKLVFLDEPTIGLDVVAKERIRSFIQHINQRLGTTIILTTHDLADVQKLCERVMILDLGRILFDGNLEDLQQRYGGSRRLVVYLNEDYEDVGLPDTEIIERKGNQVTYAFRREDYTASELIGLVSSRFRIADLQVLEPQVEATIRRIYENNLLQG